MMVASQLEEPSPRINSRLKALTDGGPTGKLTRDLIPCPPPCALLFKELTRDLIPPQPPRALRVKELTHDLTLRRPPPPGTGKCATSKGVR